ncbi:MAG: hypothetical protein HGA44_15210 [Cellulomonadaceae bacterium]|nr:hypothetical protein [Cellulomonadaceae bacterium]
MLTRYRSGETDQLIRGLAAYWVAEYGSRAAAAAKSGSVRFDWYVARLDEIELSPYWRP